jgi:glycerol-3-phosphate dehydrogenase (NAD(P)+)
MHTQENATVPLLDRFLACLSGPSFAKEVALGKPTSVTVAAKDLEIAQQVQMAVSDRAFRAYTSDDVMGVSHKDRDSLAI